MAHEQMKMVIWSVFIDVFSPGTTRLDCQYTQWPEWQWWRGDIKLSSEIRKNANFFPTWHTSESCECVRLCERSSGWMKINRGRVFTLILFTHRTTTERQTNEQSFFFAAAAAAALPLPCSKLSCFFFGNKIYIILPQTHSHLCLCVCKSIYDK